MESLAPGLGGMARARNIKPGFFTNDKLAELPPLTRILFAGLWTIADREGRLEDRPKKIKAEVLPHDSCEIEEMLQQLHDSGFIYRYSIGGAKYIHVLTFLTHQNPHVKEKPSTIPAPGKTGARSGKSRSSTGNSGSSLGNSGTSPEKTGTSPADSGFLIPDSLNLIPDSGIPQPDASFEAGASSQNDDGLPETLRRPEFKSCLTDWLAYKLERGDRYKPVGLRQMLAAAANRADAFGLPAVIAAMRKAMANGWAGWDHEGVFATEKPAVETKCRPMTDAELAAWTPTGSAE